VVHDAAVTKRRPRPKLLAPLELTAEMEVAVLLLADQRCPELTTAGQQCGRDESVDLRHRGDLRVVLGLKQAPKVHQ